MVPSFAQLASTYNALASTGDAVGLESRYTLSWLGGARAFVFAFAEIAGINGDQVGTHVDPQRCFSRLSILPLGVLSNKNV